MSAQHPHYPHPCHCTGMVLSLRAPFMHMYEVSAEHAQQKVMQHANPAANRPASVQRISCALCGRGQPVAAGLPAVAGAPEGVAGRWVPCKIVSSTTCMKHSLAWPACPPAASHPASWPCVLRGGSRAASPGHLQRDAGWGCSSTQPPIVHTAAVMQTAARTQSLPP
jgi:hypothetical protein